MTRRKMWPSEQKRKNLCRTLTKKYIRQGVLTKGPCEVCGCLEVETHHDDYSNPKDVHWLCERHHAMLHKERKASRLIARMKTGRFTLKHILIGDIINEGVERTNDSHQDNNGRA